MNIQDFKTKLATIETSLDELCAEADKSAIMISLKTQSTQVAFHFGYNTAVKILSGIHDPETPDIRKAFAVGLLAATLDLAEGVDDPIALMSPEAGHA